MLQKLFFCRRPDCLRLVGLGRLLYQADCTPIKALDETAAAADKLSELQFRGIA